MTYAQTAEALTKEFEIPFTERMIRNAAQRGELTAVRLAQNNMQIQPHVARKWAERKISGHMFVRPKTSLKKNEFRKYPVEEVRKLLK